MQCACHCRRCERAARGAAKTRAWLAGDAATLYRLQWRERLTWWCILAALALLTALTFACAGARVPPAAAGPQTVLTARQGAPPAVAHPSLAVSAHPRMAFGPLRAILMAKVEGIEGGVGGALAESLYCPTIAWDFGDGSRAVHTGDCAPWEPGARLERVFTAEHCYRESGDFIITVTMLQGSRTVLQSSGVITVRWSPGSRPC